jgi:hypothetical protein
VNTIRDIDGYLAFLEKDHWSAQIDYNIVVGHTDRRSRYATFKGEHPPGAEKLAPDDTWVVECPDMAGLNAEQTKTKIHSGWKCSH